MCIVHFLIVHCSVAGAQVGWRQSTLPRRSAAGAKTGRAGPIVRQDARGLGGRLDKRFRRECLPRRGEGPWGGPEARRPTKPPKACRGISQTTLVVCPVGRKLAERAKLPHCALFISSLFIVPLLQRSYGKARKDFSLRASLTLAAIYPASA